jgi:hypothetical protein
MFPSEPGFALSPPLPTPCNPTLKAKVVLPGTGVSVGTADEGEDDGALDGAGVEVTQIYREHIGGVGEAGTRVCLDGHSIAVG